MRIKDDNKTIECSSLEWSKAMYIVTLELMTKIFIEGDKWKTAI